MTDASNSGWGALCKGSLAFGSWSSLDINSLEMMAVFRALKPSLTPTPLFI